MRKALEFFWNLYARRTEPKLYKCRGRPPWIAEDRKWPIHLDAQRPPTNHRDSSDRNRNCPVCEVRTDAIQGLESGDSPNARPITNVLPSWARQDCPRAPGSWIRLDGTLEKMCGILAPQTPWLAMKGLWPHPSHQVPMGGTQPGLVTGECAEI